MSTCRLFIHDKGAGRYGSTDNATLLFITVGFVNELCCLSQLIDCRLNIALAFLEKAAL